MGTKADYAVDAFEATIVHDRAALVFLTPGIAAKDMTKQIYVKAHAVVDGVDVYSETERYSIAEYAYDMQYRFSADFDWCVKILSKATHCTPIEGYMVNYLEEGATTRNHVKSLKERFRIMCKHYGLLTTIFKPIWFLFRK